jgi:lipase (class 3)
MKRILFFLLLFLSQAVAAQQLKPGFDKKEYLQLLFAYSRWADSAFYNKIPESKVYKKKHRKYRSEEIGLENSWEMYETPTQSVISIRGTTNNPISWMGNFYAAMIPAIGKIQLNDTLCYDYHFADNPKAAVHVGWTLATGYLIPDIVEKIKLSYAKGKRDFIIFGHSQGAGISYLVTAQLLYYQKTGTIPKDIQFKTYCSAAPKPGNLFFAYDYEVATQNGWSTSVINPLDWVPEVPISIQTLEDFNTTNPFKNAKKMIRKLPFPKNILAGYMHNQLTKYNRKAVKKYQLFLGKIASKIVERKIKGYKSPEYYKSSNYVRTGNMVILKPDAEYYEKFPDNDSTLFVHHGLKPYIYLTEKY